MMHMVPFSKMLILTNQQLKLCLMINSSLYNYDGFFFAATFDFAIWQAFVYSCKKYALSKYNLPPEISICSNSLH